MKALAFIVGNANYDDPNCRLVNAVNDANAISGKLTSLGFEVIKRTDCNLEEFDRSLHKFSDKLKKADVGLFYFSGHGLQINGTNYLTMTDTSFTDEYSVKNRSFKLDEVIDHMNKDNVIVKILIVDACRNNPFKGKGLNPGLAPVNAPRGTILAFSTSPGETARDYGGGSNSVYTYALLNHIGEKDIPIEDFFKRVRTTVYTLTSGSQTSWEHTSLIGNFCFNSGQIANTEEFNYKDEAIADKKFNSNGTAIDNIIENLKSCNWYKQNSAINKLRSVSIKDIDRNSQFLIGRCVLSSAIGSEFSSLAIFNNLGNWLQKWITSDKDCHVLNGILYEIYFNSDGEFRDGNFKSGLIQKIFPLSDNPTFKKSFEFITNKLQEYKDKLCFIPYPNAKEISIDIIIKKEKGVFEEDVESLVLGEISISGKQIMKGNEEVNLITYRPVEYDKLLDILQEDLVVTKNKMSISTNIEITNKTEIYIPFMKFIKMG